MSSIGRTVQRLMGLDLSDSNELTSESLSKMRRWGETSRVIRPRTQLGLPLPDAEAASGAPSRREAVRCRGVRLPRDRTISAVRPDGRW